MYSALLPLSVVNVGSVTWNFFSVKLSLYFQLKISKGSKLQSLKRIILIRNIKINFWNVGIKQYYVGGKLVAFAHMYKSSAKDKLQDQIVRWNYVWSRIDR